MPEATARHSRCRRRGPGPPVAALALPDVRIDPGGTPRWRARWARLIWTGAAAARLEVNTPAAGTARPSAVATTATSSASFALMPAEPPAATKPLGAVTLTGRAPRWAGRWSRAARGRRWHTGSAWPDAPFTRLSSAQSGDHPAGARVDPGRHVRDVRARSSPWSTAARRSPPRRARRRRPRAARP